MGSSDWIRYTQFPCLAASVADMLMDMQVVRILTLGFVRLPTMRKCDKLSTGSLYLSSLCSGPRFLFLFCCRKLRSLHTHRSRVNLDKYPVGKPYRPGLKAAPPCSCLSKSLLVGYGTVHFKPWRTGKVVAKLPYFTFHSTLCERNLF